MPISESDYSYDDAANDHYDLDHHSSEPATTSAGRMMSKAELRKTHKPIMEKRRRAKINNCLNEIKDLILSAMKKDPERHSKLEKADILEMAVKHLKSIQKQQKEIAIRSDPTLALKYQSGYLECASEVSTYVDQIDGVDAGLKQRLSNHLNKCASTIERPQFDFASSSLLASFAAQSRFNHPDEQNNNAGRSVPGIQGIELIPRCLPNGDFAFLVPKASFSSMLSNSGAGVNLDAERERPERQSAFVTVMPRPQNSGLLSIAKPLSPPISPPEVPQVAVPVQVPVPAPIAVIKPKAEKLVPASASASVSLSVSASHEKIQSIKFPINTITNSQQNAHKKEHEPLCIITNAGERYRQAQRVEGSRHQEENRYLGAFGAGIKPQLKRKAEGLLTVAPFKFPRVERSDEVPSVSAFRSVKPAIYECISDDEDDADASNEGRHVDEDDKNEPMWRPW